VAREIETIVRLTRAAEFRDEVTGQHVVRVGHMCAALARTIGLPHGECEMLLLAAPMHDIGKVATPDGILLKPGPLTAAEFEIMKGHTIAGYEILKGSESPMLQCAAEIALTHHERFDGKGYPRGLGGSDIPLSGRLCSIVDVFDALTSKRPYKAACSLEKALEAVDAGVGGQFDPDVAGFFHDSMDEILAIKKRFLDPVDSGAFKEALEHPKDPSLADGRPSDLLLIAR
jgi:putative two-component system response regulator